MSDVHEPGKSSFSELRVIAEVSSSEKFMVNRGIAGVSVMENARLRMVCHIAENECN